MAESNPRVAIIVAVVGVLGTLGTALIANWDKIFLPSQQPHARHDAPQPTRPDPRTHTEPTLNISGIWYDTNYPNISAQITQNGDSFHFTRRGALPNGIGFESSGRGTIVGQRYSSSYSARYQTGVTSTGDCSGTVSVDGARLEISCRDSLLGTFPVTAVRQ
jgi:hypothetical protein